MDGVHLPRATQTFTTHKRRPSAASTSSLSASRSASERPSTRCGASQHPEDPLMRNVIWQDHEPALQPVDETVTMSRLARGAADPRVRRLRVPIFAAGVPGDRTRRAGTGRWCPVLLPAFPADRDPPARAGRGGRRGGHRAACRFWDMHALMFHRQRALEDDDLRRYATGLGLDVARFDHDRASDVVLERVRRDVDSGIAPERCGAPPPCSSTAWCTGEATTRPPCSARWPDEGNLRTPAPGHHHRLGHPAPAGRPRSRDEGPRTVTGNGYCSAMTRIPYVRREELGPRASSCGTASSMAGATSS